MSTNLPPAIRYIILFNFIHIYFFSLHVSTCYFKQLSQNPASVFFTLSLLNCWALSPIRELTTNENRVVLHCVDLGLKQDSRSMFVLNYPVFRQEISRRAILITVLTGACSKTPWLSETFSQILELS